MNPRERLQYALYLQRLHDLFVIKENIAFEYQHKNFNKAAAQIDKVVDQCLHDNILNTVEGTVTLKNPKVDHVITEALNSQKKMLVKRPDRFMERAVMDNAKQFSNFLQNRIEKENYSLQRKIDEEYRKKKYSKMPEAEAKKLIKEKFQDHARKRAKNIVRDALHTNQSHMSWINGIQGDFKYKVWMNGQGKGRVRPWHRAKLIDPVEIDDYFDIYGSSHVQMMYPGDMNGGAENVANCRCWLRYTNIAPSNLKPRGTIQINPNVNLDNGNKETFSANTEKQGLLTKINNKIFNIGSQIKNKFRNTKQTITDKFSRPKKIDINLAHEKNLYGSHYEKDPKKVVKINVNKFYGVAETEEAQLAFENKYGIKKEELTSEEYNFIKLYSGHGFSILNDYLRDIADVSNPKEIRKIKRTYSIKWLKLAFRHPKHFMSFDKSLKTSGSVFKKGKILEENLVVVRRQKKSMTAYANGNIYHSDSYLSTSISENVDPEEYGDYVSYIALPKGTRILYIEGITSTPWEFEILIDKDINLRLVSEESEHLIHWELLK